MTATSAAFLDRHPIAKRVVDQRIREAIHDWVLRNRPDVAVEMRRVILEQLDEEFWHESERLYGDTDA